MNRILPATAMALALTASASADDYTADVAHSPLAAQASLADNWADNMPPHSSCPDPTNPKTCQTWRQAVRNDGVYTIRDFKVTGDHVQCFDPGNSQSYQICVNTSQGKGWGETFNAAHHNWDKATYEDPRCLPYGNRLSVGYLVCEVAAVWTVPASPRVSADKLAADEAAVNAANAAVSNGYTETTAQYDARMAKAMTVVRDRYANGDEEVCKYGMDKIQSHLPWGRFGSDAYARHQNAFTALSKFTIDYGGEIFQGRTPDTTCETAVVNAIAMALGLNE